MTVYWVCPKCGYEHPQWSACPDWFDSLFFTRASSMVYQIVYRRITDGIWVAWSDILSEPQVHQAFEECCKYHKDSDVVALKGHSIEELREALRWLNAGHIPPTAPPPPAQPVHPSGLLEEFAPLAADLPADKGYWNDTQENRQRRDIELSGPRQEHDATWPPPWPRDLPWEVLQRWIQMMVKVQSGELKP